MKKIGRLTALLLILAISASITLLPASATDILENTANLQAAIVETALAYYNKGLCVQYDSISLSIQNRDLSGISRLTSGKSPEQGALDDTIYSVCSDYCYDIYKDALDYELMGKARNVLTSQMVAVAKSDPIIIYKFGGKDGETDRAKALSESRVLLQPGDLIVGYGDSGHAMMYIGDYKGDGKQYIIHCWGGKLDGTTGIDQVETAVKNANPEGGAIRIDDVDTGCYKDGGVWSLTSDTRGKTFVIMRPLAAADMKGHHLTDAAKARLTYRGIEVDRSADRKKYNDVLPGEELTLTLTIKNNGTQAYSGLAVTENLPAGAALKAGSASVGATESGNTITWKTDIPAGGEVKHSYVVTVTEKTGGTVTFPAGKVDGLTTREVSFRVGACHLADTQIQKMKNLGENKLSLDAKEFKAYTEAQFAIQFYEKVLGISLKIPEKLNDYLENLLTKIPVIDVPDQYGGMMWQPKARTALTSEYQRIHDMVLPEHMTGYAVYLGDDPKSAPPSMAAENRVLTLREESYQPGDIFLGICDPDVMALTSPDNAAVYIYLGEGKVAEWNQLNGLTVQTFAKTIARMLKDNFLLVLRPTLTDNIIGTSDDPLPFTDVTQVDWFYTYVRDLVKAGTVNGMTGTTFAPKGSLTYGQAIKLITLAVGETEQPAVGTHWASGYQALAKTKGWLSEDVNLDAAITRLTLCQIAAKAKGLTGQPEKNPFTDCADTSVLALVKAGIINGMTETSFEPNGTLTRAQITKIIWYMN